MSTSTLQPNRLKTVKYYASFNIKSHIYVIGSVEGLGWSLWLVTGTDHQSSLSCSLSISYFKNCLWSKNHSKKYGFPWETGLSLLLNNCSSLTAVFLFCQIRKHALLTTSTFLCSSRPFGYHSDLVCSWNKNNYFVAFGVKKKMFPDLCCLRDLFYPLLSASWVLQWFFLPPVLVHRRELALSSITMLVFLSTCTCVMSQVNMWYGSLLDSIILCCFIWLPVLCPFQHVRFIQLFNSFLYST